MVSKLKTWWTYLQIHHFHVCMYVCAYIYMNIYDILNILMQKYQTISYNIYIYMCVFPPKTYISSKFSVIYSVFLNILDSTI
jgi:hypothetical protein